MDGSGTVAVSFTPQIGRHAAVAVNTVVPVVDLIDLLPDFCFLGVIICLPVFPVVIVSVRINFQPSKQPADTECLMILVNKSISL